jgi:aspartate racemase
MKTLGLIGGMSWESTAIYYRLLNEGAKARLGDLHSAPLLLWSFDFAEIAQGQAAGEWDRLATMMADAAKALEKAGAEALVICTNTMHKLAPAVAAAVTIPLIHIADATAAAIKPTPSRRPVLLATRYTMEQDFYKGRLAQDHAIVPMVPDDAGRTFIHRVIYEELCKGVVLPESKSAYLSVISKLRQQGADGVILGCTEVCMLIGQDDTDLPVFDTTAIHVDAALDFAMQSG